MTEGVSQDFSGAQTPNTPYLQKNEKKKAGA